MEIIYIKRDEINHILGLSSIKKISTPITYDRPFDVDKYTRLELSVYLMYQDGMLLVRNTRLRDTPGVIPSTELCIPPAFYRDDIFKSEQTFHDVLEWNAALAISNVTSYGYEDALNHGLVNVLDMLHHTLKLSAIDIKYHAVNDSFEGEWVRICSYVVVTEVNDRDKCAYVDYESFKRYYRYKKDYWETYHGYADMDKYSPIFSKNDHRVVKSDEIWSAFEGYRYAK